MELKVWVDGIQRVICGVTESSTCQDVVYALAHATGQIGRFTLVEKWRNSERLLAPNEQPLKVLMKWGEYANDVHFVMRRSQTDPKAHGSGNHQFGQNNKRQHDFYPSLPSSCIDQNSKPPINKEIKKSLTFSCGHSSSGNTENSSPNIVNSNSLLKIEQPAASRNAKNRDGRSRQDLPKGVVRGVPQRPKDNKIVPKDSSLVSKPERPKNPPPYDEAVSRSTNRFTPSHLTITSPVKQYSQDEESPSSKRPHLSDRIDVLSCSDKINSLCQPYNTQINFQDQQMTDHGVDYGIKSHDISYHNSNISHLASQEKSGNSPEKILLSTCINFPEEQKIKLKRNVKEKYDDGSIPNQQKHHITPQNNCDVLPDDLNADPQYQDLLRLVSLQREKLENQQSELTQYDAEIVYWEEKLQEQETKLSLLQEEVCHLELTQHEQEGELVQLDRRPLGEEVELGRQEERTLRSELTLARSQLANCETELLQCRQRIRLLLEDIAEEKRLRSRREELETKEREEQENHLQSQVDCLQQQLTEKAQESENRKNAADEFKKELQGLEFKLSEKQKEMQKLMEDIRAANLYSLSLTPADDGKFANEGNFYNRAGSTRKIIGSPRQLENAVPTNKNPHGVWV